MEESDNPISNSNATSTKSFLGKDLVLNALGEGLLHREVIWKRPSHLFWVNHGDLNDEDYRAFKNVTKNTHHAMRWLTPSLFLKCERAAADFYNSINSMDFLSEYNVSTAFEQNAWKEQLTWNATYDLATGCLRYPDFSKCYQRRDLNVALWNKRYDDVNNMNVSRAEKDKLLAMRWFELSWKLTPEHRGFLLCVSASTGVDAIILASTDKELRRRLLDRECKPFDSFDAATVESKRGMHYMLFNYFHKEEPKARWLLVRHSCASCGEHHDYSSEDLFRRCELCGDASKCAHCGFEHVHTNEEDNEGEEEEV